MKNSRKGFIAPWILALVALIKWKRRRDLAAARVNRGLRGYVAAEVTVEPPAAEETQGKKKKCGGSHLGGLTVKKASLEKDLDNRFPKKKQGRNWPE